MTEQQPLPWATSRHTAGVDPTTVPEYGSPAYEALPADDPRRTASLVRAAECWRAWTSPEGIETRVELELQVLADAEAGIDPDQLELAARIEATNRRTIDQVARRMLEEPLPPPSSRPIVQTEDWPTVVMPGAPTTALMIRRQLSRNPDKKVH